MSYDNHRPIKGAATTILTISHINMAPSFEKIAISGFSGRYANCLNVEEFREGLFSGTDFITTNHSRWPHEALNLPPRLGLIKDAEYFDANFFAMNPNEANESDVRLRKILEVSFEAIVDAGLNPTELRGSNTAVIFAITPNYHVTDLGIKYGILTVASSLMANRISYAFDFNGPSYVVDTACSSGLYALNQAVDLINIGRTDTVLVCAAQCHFDPSDSADFLKYGVINMEGKCKVYDLHRNGYVKSEAVVAMLVQKAKDCKRIYCDIVGSNTNVDGFKQEGAIHPSHEMQKRMLEDAFKRYNIDPTEVVYMETHGTGTVVGDMEETEGLDEFFFKNRNRKVPLLIGAVKSNHGHSETASGLVSLSKILISIQEGIIPANLHYKTPDPSLTGIAEGRLKVIDKHTPLPDGLIGVIAFGLGGANGSAILRPYLIKKQQNIENNLSHRLVCVSGASKEGVQVMLSKINEHKRNKEFLSLIDNIFSTPINNHIYRGFTVLSDDTKPEVTKFSLKKRPIWFAFSGLGSQWPGMARDLMKIETFRNTIHRCAEALKPYGIDLENVVVSEDPEILTDLTNIFISITATSIALTDVLAELGIKPEGIIGHSLGEVSCSYADGLTTAEQAILCAYGRAYAVKSSNLIPGFMAAVGMSAEECQKRLPKDIYIACDNSDDNITLSGPEGCMKDFLKELTSEGIFNKVVYSSGYAFHCPHLEPITTKLYEFINSVLPERKLRSRWIPTALPETEWQSELGLYNSVKYQLCNCLNRVHFREALKKVPKDAILIEVAPRGLFQAIFRRALDKTVTILPVSSSSGNNLEFFLTSIGKIHNSGGHVDLRKLYKPTSFPVSINTPTISNLIRWDHSTKWTIPVYNPTSSFGNIIEIDMNDPKNEYLKGHTVDSKFLLPATVYLVLAWQSLAKMLGKPLEETPVVFENVKLEKAVFLSKNQKVAFVINILNSSGHFEVRIKNEEFSNAMGKIYVPQDIDKEFLDYSTLPEPNQYKIKMNCDDFYKAFNLRGSTFSGMFRSIQQYDLDGRRAVVNWENNWITFLDSLSQIFGFEKEGLTIPASFVKIIINPKEHLRLIGTGNTVPVNFYTNIQTAKCGCVEIKQLAFTSIKRRLFQEEPVLEKYVFVPNTTYLKDQTYSDSLTHVLRVVTEIVAENNMENLSLKIANVGNGSEIFFEIIKSAVPRIIGKDITCHHIDTINEDIINDYFDLLIVGDITKEKDETILACSKSSKFMLAKIKNYDEGFFDLFQLEIIYKHVAKCETYVLLRTSQNLPEDYTIISVSNNNFCWLEDFKSAVNKYRSSNSRIYLVNKDYNSGLLGFFRTARLEKLSPNLRIFITRNGKEVEQFSVRSKFYTNQLKKDISVNIYHNDCWGTYRSFPLDLVEKHLFDDAYYINVASGKLKGLNWIERTPYTKKNGRNISIYVATVNQHDILLYQGKRGLYITDDILGVEYAGIDEKGNKVMGLVSSGALATSVQSHPHLIWNIPKRWSFEQAATVPYAYVLSYYGLFVQNSPNPDNFILIHNCTSDVSLAAIALSLNENYTVYTVVETFTEKEYLLKLFPKLQDDNIIIRSETIAFYELVLKQSKVNGVNIIFNCNSIDFLKLSMECASPNARFIEIDSTIDDLFIANEMMKKNFSLQKISILKIFNENEKVLNTIANNIENLLTSGVVIPLPHVIFEKDNIAAAIKQLEDGEYDQKCLIRIKNKGGFFTKPDNRILAFPRTYLNPEKCYVIVGGLGGFGLELANWLITRGATKLILNSRREVHSGYQAWYLNQWKQRGIAVLTDISDTSTLEGAETLLNYALNLAPVGGIFNTALVLKDKPLMEQSMEDYIATAAPKIFSSQNLDFLSRKLCNKLDYFVIFSSLVSCWGNPTQANYGFANSAMENLCESRKAEGLHALAIQWGPIADVGFLQKLNIQLKIAEANPQKMFSCLDALDQMMLQNETIVSSCVYSSDDNNEDDLEEAEKSVIEAVVELFGIKNYEDLDDSKTLMNLGMDSLLNFEIQHKLETKYQINIPVPDIKHLTIGDLKKMGVK